MLSFSACWVVLKKGLLTELFVAKRVFSIFGGGHPIRHLLVEGSCKLSFHKMFFFAYTYNVGYNFIGFLKFTHGSKTKNFCFKESYKMRRDSHGTRNHSEE